MVVAVSSHNSQPATGSQAEDFSFYPFLSLVYYSSLLSVSHCCMGSCTQHDPLSITAPPSGSWLGGKIRGFRVHLIT